MIQPFARKSRTGDFPVLRTHGMLEANVAAIGGRPHGFACLQEQLHTVVDAAGGLRVPNGRPDVGRSCAEAKEAEKLFPINIRSDNELMPSRH